MGVVAQFQSFEGLTMPHSSADPREYDQLPPPGSEAGAGSDAVPSELTAPVDPVISPSTAPAVLASVVRPTPDDHQEPHDGLGFVRHVAESFREAWQRSAGEDTAEEWAGYDAEALAAEAEAQQAGPEGFRFGFDPQTAPATHTQPLIGEPSGPVPPSPTPREVRPRAPRGWLGVVPRHVVNGP